MNRRQQEQAVGLALGALGLLGVVYLATTAPTSICTNGRILEEGTLAGRAWRVICRTDPQSHDPYVAELAEAPAGPWSELSRHGSFAQARDAAETALT